MVVALMHWNLKNRLDKLDSAAKRDLTSAEIDEILNQAQTELLNQLYSIYEVDQNITDLLNTFTVTSSITPTSSNPYEVTLPANYRNYIKAEINDTTCNKFLDVYISKQDELLKNKKNPFKKPSSKWNSALGYFENNKLLIYTENNANSVKLTYLRKPAEITIGGYNDINGVLKVATNCEFPDHFHDTILDKARQIAEGMLQDQIGYQIATNQINKQ